MKQPCRFCKTLFDVNRNTRHNVYCSHKCSCEHKKDKTVEKWLEGESTGLDGSKQLQIKDAIREFLIKEAGYKCTICSYEGYNELDNRSILQIDHIDGNASNNSPSNLRVICPNCHAKSPNYGSRNMGSGRATRYK